jgi:hypothetical protein
VLTNLLQWDFSKYSIELKPGEGQRGCGEVLLTQAGDESACNMKAHRKRCVVVVVVPLAQFTADMNLV